MRKYPLYSSKLFDTNNGLPIYNKKIGNHETKKKKKKPKKEKEKMWGGEE